MPSGDMVKSAGHEVYWKNTGCDTRYTTHDARPKKAESVENGEESY